MLIVITETWKDLGYGLFLFIVVVLAIGGMWISAIDPSKDKFPRKT